MSFFFFARFVSGVHGHERKGRENLKVTEAISRDELETFSEEKMGRIRL
jgi:hypothetical protein